MVNILEAACEVAIRIRARQLARQSGVELDDQQLDLVCRAWEQVLSALTAAMAAGDHPLLHLERWLALEEALG